MTPRFSRNLLENAAQQRGAIGLMAALTLALAVLFMGLMVDSGRLYLERRQLQRVADMAALEAVNLGGNCLPSTTTPATTYATASAVRNSFTVPGTTSRTLTTTCGSLTTNANNLRVYTVNSAATDAVRVVVTESVKTSVIAGISAIFSGANASTNSVLSATAVAASQGTPLAQLTIRSTLASVDTSKSALLNSVFGGLLGSTVNLSAASYNALLSGNINLLSFLNQLAVNLGVTAGDYTTLLNTNVGVGQILSAAGTVLSQNGNTAAVAINGLAATLGNGTLVKLGSLLNVQSGTTASALNVNLQAFSLIQSVIQLGNSSNSATASIPITGLGQSITTTLKVIQPAQLSAVGNPALAKLAPLGANEIYVRTAQTRALVTIALPALDGLSSVINAVTNVLAPVTTLLNSLLSLNLVSTLNGLTCLVGSTCVETSILILPAPVVISLSLDTASGASYVSDYTCPTKSLTTQNSTSAIDMSLGKIDSTTAFSSSTPPTATPLAVIDIGTQSCKALLGLNFNCAARVPYAGGGFGFMLNHIQVAAASQPMIYTGSTVANEINATPTWQSFSTANIGSALTSALSGVTLKMYAPGSGSSLGSALSLVGTAFTTLQTTIQALVQPLLASVITPLLNQLADQLGVNLAQVEVGANLSCNFGGRPGLTL